MKLQDIRNMDKDDFLGLLGLESKHSFTNRLLGNLGTFGIGLLVGAGVALLLAPKAGSDLRQDLRAKLHRRQMRRCEWQRDAGPARAVKRKADSPLHQTTARYRQGHGYVADVDPVAHIDLEGRNHHAGQNEPYTTAKASVDVLELGARWGRQGVWRQNRGAAWMAIEKCRGVDEERRRDVEAHLRPGETKSQSTA